MLKCKFFFAILFSLTILMPAVFAQDSSPEGKYLLQRIGVDAKIIPFAGAAIPLDKFAHIDDGRAKTGFAGGIDVVGNGFLRPVLHISYSANGTDQGVEERKDTSTTWKSVLVLGGLTLLSGKVSDWGSYYAAPLVGILIGSKPLNYYYSGRWVNQITDADNRISFAAGLSAGVSYKNFTISAMFAYAAPKYETNDYMFAAIIPIGDRDITNKFEILQLSLGYAL